MANARRFRQNMYATGKRVEDNSTRLVRKCALAVDAAVVMATPVDTGRARANWQVGINDAITTADRERFSQSGRESIAAAQQEIKGFRTSNPNDKSIHITNNLDYIGRLNDGWSAQAPAAFVEQAVMVGVNAIRGAKITVGKVQE